MATVTVHERTFAFAYTSLPTHEMRNTHVPPGTYRLHDHYFRRNGLEVAWVFVTGHNRPVALTLEPGDLRTWNVSEDTETTDYRR